MNKKMWKKKERIYPRKGEFYNVEETGVAWCGAFVLVGMGVGECQSEDSFVYFGVKPTQGLVQDFLWDWEKMRKGKIPGQSTEESS